MPSAFYAIRDRLLNEQQKAGGRKAGADYVFDIPVELCKSLIGYRYSQDIAGAEKNPFEALLETRSDAENKKPSLWSRLFGSARRG
jgi:hypothetical protein